MNIIPIMGFYMRRHEQIRSLAGALSGNPGAVVALATALVPVVKKHWPQFNADGILDDALTTLQQTLDDGK